MSKNIINKTIDFKISQDTNKIENKSKNFLSNIDYNYPSLNRKDLSDLSNINDKKHQFKKLNTNRDWSLNLYNLDIEGSSPRKFGYFFNKVDFTNKNSDIEKSSPKDYNQNINKISFNLTNDDIEFSKPQCVKKESKRHTNPLQPKYIFKSPEILPITPPKFIRDAMEINDIKGSRPKKIGNDKNLFKEPIKKELIKDSWPKKPYLRKTKYEFLDYRDVTTKNINHRDTNPLRPIYNWSYVDDKKSFGPIDGNYPLVYSKYLYKKPFNLSNKDIEGSNIGSKNRYKKFHGTNYSYNTRDINGAQSNTIARGIITTRHINPIVPKYKYLGHSEIPDIDNNPYNIGFLSPQPKKDKNTSNNINIINSEKNKELNIKKNDNESNKIIEKKIKIVDNKSVQKEYKDDYKVFIRSDGKPDFGNFPLFNDKVDFEKNNYKKPTIFYGFSHYQYLLPSDLSKNTKKQNNFQKLNILKQNINNKEVKRRSASTISKEQNNYYTKLDDFMNSRNLKYIESKNQNNANIQNPTNENNDIQNKDIENNKIDVNNK